MDIQLKELAETKLHKQELKLRCLEIAAQMMGPQSIQPNETVQQYLNRYIPLSNVIEAHATKFP